MLASPNGQLLRAEQWVFSPTRDVVYVMLADRAGVVAIDLVTGEVLWHVVPRFVASEGETVANVTSDDRTLVIGDDERVFFIDTKDGTTRAMARIGPRANDVADEMFPFDDRVSLVA